MVAIKNIKQKKSNSNFKYTKLCAFDRKCFTHKDKTNEMFCNMIKNNLKKDYNNILCLDSALTKTSNMLIDKNITQKENIILIEANKNNHKKQITNGFNSIFGKYDEVIQNYYLDKFDGIYLDAIGSVKTVSELVFDTVKKNLTNNDCVIGYTFSRRGKKGETFSSSYEIFRKKFNLKLKKLGYKVIDSESYIYGSPRTKQANMFTEFICLTKN